MKDIENSVENNLWKPQQKLPMYKDKPYGAQYPTGKRNKKKWVLSAFLFGAILYIVFNFGRISNVSFYQSKEPESWLERKNAVRQAFKTSWKGYKKAAWGDDVFRPVSKQGENMGPAPLGWIVVDSLDTMYLMGLTTEFRQARKWVEHHLDYDMDYEVNTFETTIRMLGGLLSAYFLTDDDLFLDKAVDLGNRLSGAFDSPSGIPFASVNLASGKGKGSHTDSGASSTAEAATLQLEFKYLAKLTGEEVYWKNAEKVMEIIERNHAAGGLVPIFIQPNSGDFQGNLIRLGSRGDSYYEYLIKQYLQTEEQELVYLDMYEEVLAGIEKYILKKSKPTGLVFIGELESGVHGPVSNKMDHLVCFAGGMYALGATKGLTIDEARKQPGWSPKEESQFTIGMELTRTCYEMYNRTATGLSPEIVVFNDAEGSTKDFKIKPADVHNLQRPETVESLFILWRLTRNPIYREWGWNIFKSFETHTKLSDGSGYTSLQDVTKVPAPQRDNMESFWLSETLKYLYLLFDDSKPELCPLDQVVFNTEAHPFPKFSMGTKFSTGWKRSSSEKLN